MSETILKLENIVKTYQSKTSFFGAYGDIVVALNQVSLNILKGEILGLVGESGSGKTTAGRLIVRLEEPDSGNIYLNGQDIKGIKGKAARDFRKKVQMIFQDPYQSLNPQFSVFDTVSEPLVVHRIGTAEEKKGKVRKIMKSVGLSPPDFFLNRYPHQLSGGQRQRVAIARAMVLGPEFVVADEPTSMLDASISAQIFNILLKMREKYQVTLLFITHSLAAARYLCDRIAVIYKGNLIEVGPADVIIQHPRHPYTQALLDALPKFGSCETLSRYGTLLKEERVSGWSGSCPFFVRCGVAGDERCVMESPPLRDLGQEHFVACFIDLADGDSGPDAKACQFGI